MCQGLLVRFISVVPSVFAVTPHQPVLNPVTTQSTCSACACTTTATSPTSIIINNSSNIGNTDSSWQLMHSNHYCPQQQHVATRRCQELPLPLLLLFLQPSLPLLLL
jgi:hypothetical protein